MEYIENGQEQNIDEKQLKQCLTEYYRSVKKLSELLHNSNIIGTYSEILVCAVLGLIKESDSHIGTDAKGADGKTYQIKSRWNKTFLGKNGQNEFGSFAYSTKKYPFDFLILVYYEGNLLTPKVFKIKSSHINLLLGKGAQIKKKRVIFRYNASFKKTLAQGVYISDISDQFNNIYT